MSLVANDSQRFFSGTYIPVANSAAATIETGAAAWTHFLIVPHILPYSSGYTRCLGQRYVDFDMGYALFTYGPSREDTVPNDASVYVGRDFEKFVIKNGSTITFYGFAPSQGGAFLADWQYDWYAW